MTAQLIGAQPIALSYDSRAGQYRGSNGRFVPRSTVQKEVDAERARLETRVQGLARRLTNERIALPEFQVEFAETLKRSHLNMMSLSAGGREGLTKRHLGAVGQQLRQEYQYLDGFAKDIAAGRMTPSQIVYRAGLYAQSTAQSFNQGEVITKKQEGFNLAKRLTDPAAKHCPECPLYVTPGYVEIENIVAIGQQCSCRGRCRCKIQFLKMNLTDFIQPS